MSNYPQGDHAAEEGVEAGSFSSMESETPGLSSGGLGSVGSSGSDDTGLSGLDEGLDQLGADDRGELGDTEPSEMGRGSLDDFNPADTAGIDQVVSGGGQGLPDDDLGGLGGTDVGPGIGGVPQL